LALLFITSFFSETPKRKDAEMVLFFIYNDGRHNARVVDSIEWNLRRSLVTTAVAAASLCSAADAQTADPVAPSTDHPASLSVAPVHVYRSPSITGTSQPESDPGPASGPDDLANRQTPSIEKPDNWACRTSNNLARSSAGKNPDGKSTFDIERLLPKC
jgi:hypothetical protein